MYGLFIIISIFYSYKEVATGGGHIGKYFLIEKTHIYSLRKYFKCLLCVDHILGNKIAW